MNLKHNQYAGDLDPIERRLQIQWLNEQREDYEFPVPIQRSELPRSTSHSGWMRTEREANTMTLLLGPNPTKMKRKKNLRCRRD